jgi:hypothetical protein
MGDQDSVHLNTLNKTRKKRREPESKSKEREEWEDWKGHLEKGYKLFEYMIEHFKDMFISENIIKEFDIRPGLYGYGINEEEIMEMYGDDIQNQLLSWIQTEVEGKRFFDRVLWKSFRDQCTIRASYLGYKKMFQYNSFFFQIIIDDCCGRCDYFKDNIICKKDNCVHFELALYAWKTEGNHIEPDFFNLKESDMMYPEKLWNLKNGM